MSEARIQTLKGNWKEVKGEEMLEIVARMILLAERDTSSTLVAEVTPKEDADMTSKEATVKVTKKRKNILTKIVNWVTKQSRDASPTKKAATSAGVEASSTVRW